MHLLPFELRAAVRGRPARSGRRPRDDPAQLLHELHRRARRAAGRQQVVHDQHPLPGGDRVAVHLEAVGAVLQRIAGADRCRRQLSELAHRHEPGAEAIRDRAAEDEAAALDADDQIDAAPANGAAMLSIAMRNPSGSRSSVVTS